MVFSGASYLTLALEQGLRFFNRDDLAEVSEIRKTLMSKGR